ncbi:MAG: type VI secretion system baseplate subunit TssF [Helicobacteraceae bacterium]|jgi:type VI secretion system protein ImpG|nr:type VI secretion system baseplate subunit TssF [Helicobacteraceae bacterium]
MQAKIKDYYLRELESLRRLGGEFSRKNPSLAPYLSKEGQDPDVERTLEGFAFLAGRIRYQLEEELPELSHNLAQLLWPNYMRSTPSYSIIAYEPNKNYANAQVIPIGTQVLSEPTKEGVQCRFRTCYETTVYPFVIDRVEYNVYGNKSGIEIDLAIVCKGGLADCPIDSLRLYFNATYSLSNELYLYFLKYIEYIDAEIIGDNDEVLRSVKLPTGSVLPVGFGINERLMPYPKNVFDGYIVLQEYYAFIYKHFFVDITNMGRIFSSDQSVSAKSRCLRLKLYFSKRFAAAQSLYKDQFALYCTPVINLFEADAVPVRKNAYEEEYLLSPSDYERDYAEVFQVERVRGWVKRKNNYVDFMPFESFGYEDDNEYYSIRVRLSEDGKRTNSFIRFGSPDGVFENGESDGATISVRLLCSNRSLPSSLQLGQICIPDAQFGFTHMKFRNITIPTNSYPPPIGGDFLWRIISNMSLNYVSLADPKTLGSVMSAYDFIGATDAKADCKNALILTGIKSIKQSKTEMVYKGLPIYGTRISMEIDTDKFAGVGEAYLMCCVLNEFFALYRNINSFHILEAKMINLDSYEWPPKLGAQPVM